MLCGSEVLEIGPEWLWERFVRDYVVNNEQ